jgi:hypothetical protein
MPEIAEHLGLSAPQSGRLVRGALRALRAAIEGASATARCAPAPSAGVRLPDTDPQILAALGLEELADTTAAETSLALAA